MRSALLLAVALLAAACGSQKPSTEQARPVLTQVVQPGASLPADVYSGEIRARNEADLAFRVGGKIVSRPVDAGARVSRGQVLARLDPEDAKLASRASAAQRASAESDLVLAKAELDRHAELLDKKFISASAFDAKKNAYNAALARAEQARAQEEISTNQAGYTTLVADADGVVVSVAAEPGQVVSAGQPVLRLARAGEKEVVVSVAEGQLARFRPGVPAMVRLWSDASMVFPGKVREVAGGADPVTRTYLVRISTPTAPEAAQIGMTANVALEGGSDARLVLLPLAALAGERAEPFVWVVDAATSRVKARKVVVAQYREDGVAIRSGLEAGDVVVIAGAHRLRQDQPVRRAAPL